MEKDTVSDEGNVAYDANNSQRDHRPHRQRSDHKPGSDKSDYGHMIHARPPAVLVSPG
jgi:hypothetical protein